MSLEKLVREIIREELAYALKLTSSTATEPVVEVEAKVEAEPEEVEKPKKKRAPRKKKEIAEVPKEIIEQKTEPETEAAPVAEDLDYSEFMTAVKTAMASHSGGPVVARQIGLTFISDKYACTTFKELAPAGHSHREVIEGLQLELS